MGADSKSKHSNGRFWPRRFWRPSGWQSSRIFSPASRAPLERQVLEVLQRPAAAECIAVFWEGAPPVNHKPGPLMKFLTQSQYAETFAPLNGPALATWYRQQAKRHGVTLEPAALLTLQELVGDDLWRADNELGKLAAYCHGRPGTTEDVQTLVADEVEENIFALTDAIGQRRTSDALKLLHQQQRAGVNPLELTAKITWHYRNLLHAKAWLVEHGGRASSWTLAEELDLHPFVAKKTLGQVVNFSLPELVSRYRQLLTLDRKMKSGAGDPAALLTLLVASHAPGK